MAWACPNSHELDTRLSHLQRGSYNASAFKRSKRTAFMPFNIMLKLAHTVNTMIACACQLP